MFANVKRVLAVVLVLAMVVAFVPAMSASATTDPNPWAEERTIVNASQDELEAKREAFHSQMGSLKEDAIEVPEKAYDNADAVFAAIDGLKDAPATKDMSAEAFTQKVVEIVTTSASYKADSVEIKGEVVLWWTTDGIHCMYNPRMEKIAENFVPENSEDVIVNEPVQIKGGQPSSKEVYLIGPYYGIDSSFTNQYKNEASRIAKAIGDTDGYTLYSGRKVSVDKVAEAVSNGAVVLYDSHGATDYSNGSDYVSGAENSYLCLNNDDGMTYDDYLDGALYGGGEAYVNGATIVNHMTKNSPGGISWFATCLSMATNTLCNPLRSKGVEVVYGYSQSVTFIGEYEFEEAFWDAFLKQGTSVKDAITAMKNKCGNWDLAVPMVVNMGYPANQGYATISEARADYCAFPIVVSDEDAHPGQRYYTSNWGADIVQTVKSTYTLGSLPGNGNPNQSGSGGTTPSPAGNYHAQVIQWINEFGKYDNSQGVWWIGLEMESSNFYYTYYFNDLNGQIWLESWVQPKSGSGYGVNSNVYLTEGETTFDIEGNVLYYYYGSLIDAVTAGGWDDRADFKKTTSYNVSGSGSYITSSKFKQWFNDGLQDLFLESDKYIYQNLDFGVKCLGFVNYDGYGPDPVVPPAALPGDMNSDNTINNDDVIALMWHNLFPSQYPLTANTDINHDGTVNNDDVILLMWHNLFPDSYPLS